VEEVICGVCVCLYLLSCLYSGGEGDEEEEEDGWEVDPVWAVGDRQTSRGPRARWTTDLSVHKRVSCVTEQREGIDREECVHT